MIVLGTQLFPATGDVERRQRNGASSLARLRGAIAVNLQFPDEDVRHDGLETLAVLRRDSRTVTGRDGPRKPIASDVFAALAERARAASAAWFGWANGDVIVAQELVDRVESSKKEALVFCRGDFDEGKDDVAMMIYGADAFVVATAWWSANAHRFRDYIVGEMTWDTVYASILLRHADAAIENRRALIRHERHAPGWRESPFGAYLALLAALDAPDFSRWVEYVSRLERLRAASASEAEELELVRVVFKRDETPLARAVQLARALRARVRYALAK